ncbi:MAG: acetyl-CoA C-acyltransferase [Actinomycetales bacterium]|nr:MAG: acetyl-CoA C-acyltransferase [Actinomycetales bacterium]
MPEAVVVATARSPIGRAVKGSLKDVRPDDLSVQVIESALAKVPELDLSAFEDVIWGAAELSGKHGANFARVIAVLLGNDALPGTSVNRFCATSVQTTRMAFHAIKAGEGHAFITGGVESVSQYTNFVGAGGMDPDDINPKFHEAIARSEEQAKQGAPWVDPRESGNLPNIYIAMGQTAENVAQIHGISRERQDEWGLISQQRAGKAIEDGFYAAEITPITLPDGSVVDTDDGPRPGTTLEALQSLKPVFRENGTVTAGNCCALNDGAATVIVTSDTFAKDHGLTPMARVVATAASALSPELMGLGPIEATRKALKLAGMTIDDMDLYEINEAFASQVLPSADQLGMDFDKLNVRGGAIALGHPFGCTGARITTTLLHAMQERDAQFGLETMCVGGGQGMAIIYERLS